MDQQQQDPLATPLLAETEQGIREQSHSSDSTEGEITSPMSHPSTGEEQRVLGDRLSPSHQSIVKGIFFLLGIGILAPWNAFISAKDYFVSRLCGDTAIENKFALVYNLASVVSLVLMITIQAAWDGKHSEESSRQASPTGSCLPASHLENDPLTSGTTSLPQSSQKEPTSASTASAFWLVMIPLSIYCGAFFVQAILVVLPNLTTPWFVALTFGSLAVTAMAGSVAQVGIVATATQFHSDMAMSPYLAGMSAGGLAISIANLVAAIWEDPAVYETEHCSGGAHLENASAAESNTCTPYTHIDWGAAGYFVVGCLTLVVCSMGYAYIYRLQQDEKGGRYDAVAAVSTVEASPRIGLEMLSQQRRNELQEDKEENGERDVTPSSAPDGLMRDAATDHHDHLAEVWTTVQAPVLSVFLAFVVTLALFPAWTSQLRSVHQCHERAGRLANDLYTPVSFVVFNGGDLMGRILSSQFTASRVRNLSPKLLFAALGRFAFFVLFLFCAASHNRSLVLVPSDVYSFLIQFCFAVSGGCLVSTCFVHAGSLVSNSSTVSEYLNLAVSLGLFCGSLLSFPTVKLLGGV